MNALLDVDSQYVVFHYIYCKKFVKKREIEQINIYIQVLSIK